MVLKIGDGLFFGHTEPFPSSGVVRGSAPAEKNYQKSFLFCSTVLMYNIQYVRAEMRILSTEAVLHEHWFERSSDHVVGWEMCRARL